MKIVQAPEQVLSQVAKPINTIDKNILGLIDEMKKTLVSATDPEGVGLAAPQIGKSLQLFIVKPTPKDDFSIYINPQVTIVQEKENQNSPKKKKTDNRLEGCLSLKDIWGTVKRAPKVSMTWTDESGKQHKQIFSGFISTILQHEYDHLQGVLFPKRVLEQSGKLYKSHKDEKGEEVFDLIEL